jgi:hypothetical protein
MAETTPSRWAWGYRSICSGLTRIGGDREDDWLSLL